MSVEKEPSKELLGTFKDEGEAKDEYYEAILKDLPKEKNFNDLSLYHYQGFWVSEMFLRGIISVQSNFVARDDDIILTSCPKSGNTWLKALMFSIVNRTRNGFALTSSPLLEKNPHDLVPLLEEHIDLLESFFQSPKYNEAYPPLPRLLSTHIPYESLPTSIKTSGCKIVYISRNPMDLFVSLWHFTGKFLCKDAKRHGLEECFDRFCHGIHSFGPFWNHVLGFWKANQKRPEKILFMKYEDMKKDTFFNVKRLAEFLGFPFSEEEEKLGLVEEIITSCSFERMRNLEANKNGTLGLGKIPRSAFFRKGEVGDSRNFLTPAMIERMGKIMQENYGRHLDLISSSNFLSECMKT